MQDLLEKTFSVKNFLTATYAHYYPYLNLAYDSTRALNSLFEKEKKTSLSYVETGISIKLIYDRFQENLAAHQVKIHPFNRNPTWSRLCKVSEMENVIYEILLTCDETVKLQVDSLKNDDGDNDKVVYYNFKDIEFCVCFRRKELYSLLVKEASRVQEIKDFVLDKAWQKLDTNHVRYDAQKRKLVAEESSITYPTELSERISVDLVDYIQYNYTRSILFYGPPGSGKSNLIKNIYFNSDYRSLRLNIKDLSDELVGDLIKLLQPTIVIIDDIDHGLNGNMSMDNVLRALEDIHTGTKVLLASANVVSKLDPALQRPGRFDELVEVKCLDRKVHLSLVDNDEELLEFTKEFPAAYTLEFMKRVKVKGKTYALNHSKDIVDRVKNLENHNYDLEDDY